MALSIIPADEAGSTNALAAPARGQTAREELMSRELAVSAETSIAAAAAQAQAMVQARFMMAIRYPRDLDDVRTKLLRACERPGFAGSASERTSWGAAWYRKPVGEGVEGFSIRFAEECARAMGNIDCRSIVTYDGPDSRLLDVIVLDLEGNAGYSKSIAIDKTIERKRLPKGETAIRTRTNAAGETVYVIRATDDDVAQKQAVAESKAYRNGILRLVPGDIQAECRARILKIRAGDVPTDPDALRRKVADAFAALNVTPSDLKELTGCELAQLSPAQRLELLELHAAIKRGETSWQAVIEEVREERASAAEAKEEAGDDVPASGPTGLAGVTARLKARASGGDGGAPPSGPAAPPPAK